MNEEYQIWRVVDPEGDIWAENAIVFPINKDPMEYFTIENIYEMYNVSKQDKEYYDYIFVERDWDSVKILTAKWKDYENWKPTDFDNNDIYFDLTFYKMSKVKIFEK